MPRTTTIDRRPVAVVGMTMTIGRARAAARTTMMIVPGRGAGMMIFATNGRDRSVETMRTMIATGPDLAALATKMTKTGPDRAGRANGTMRIGLGLPPDRLAISLLMTMSRARAAVVEETTTIGIETMMTIGRAPMVAKRRARRGC
jgi:hypothetical protein